MSNPTKILKERIERLIDLVPYNTIRMKLILNKAIDEINLIIADEMKNLDDIEMKIMMQKGKIRLEIMKNSLDEFEMNASEIKINAETEILKNEEKRIRNIIDCLKNSSLELLDLYTNKKRDITDYFKESEYEYKKYKSVKN